MSKGWNRWRYTRFPVRGGRQIPGPTGNSSLFVVFGVRAGHVAGKGTKKDVASYESAYLAKGSYCANWNCKIANWTCSRTRPSPASLPLDSTETVFVEKYFPASFSLRYLSLHAFPLSRDFNTWNYATRGLFDRV